MVKGPPLVVKPVTPQRWDDFAALFEARGSPHYCWCAPYRFADAHKMDKAQKRAAMRKRVKAGTPVGVLAYRDGAPVGWCSVAPREAYDKLDRATSMPRVDDAPTWAILCFFVPRAHRGEGIAAALLAGAVDAARKGGAQVVEGWPHDAAGTTATHRGTTALFEAAGFRVEGRRAVLRIRSGET